MRNKKLLKFFGVILSITMIASGCGANGDDGSNTKANLDQVNAMKMEVKNEGTPVSDAEMLTIGYLVDNPFRGQFNPVFATNAEDLGIMGYGMLGAFPSDDLQRVEQDRDDAMFKFHIDRDNKKYIITAHKDLKWSNGQDVTADDIISTYKLMGNPKFVDNQRYNEDYEIIVGMKDYHEGKADNISGIKKVDEKTVEFNLTEVNPSLLWGKGLIYDFLNRDQVASANLDHFWESDLNINPLSYGPYYIAKNNNGESILFKSNQYYFKGEPELKEFKVVGVPIAQSVEKVKSGEIDIVQVATYDFPRVKELTNGTILARDPNSYSYIGFKFGKFENGKNVVDPNNKFADINLRKAITMCIDRNAYNSKFYHGVGQTPTGSGIYTPYRKAIYNKDGEKIPYDVEGAKKLLDESGYKDVDGDGLREDKNGNKLEIRYMGVNGNSDIDEPATQLIIQSMKNIGLDAKLTDDKLISGRDAGERLINSDESFDMFMGGWSLGSSPDPSDIFSSDSRLNYYRYTSDKLTNALKAVRDPNLFDEKEIIEAYKNLDKVMADELFQIPLRWGKELIFVNNRISEWNIDPFDKKFLNDGERIGNIKLLDKKPKTAN